uniref:RUN domain-containing protein n=1 Tax=Brugia timori TaxID=42155 RepID=A0A0R3QYN5_9BILA
LVREIADLHVLDYDFKLEDLCIISLLRNGVSSDLFNILPFWIK